VLIVVIGIKSYFSTALRADNHTINLLLKTFGEAAEAFWMGRLNHFGFVSRITVSRRTGSPDDVSTGAALSDLTTTVK